MFEVIMKWFPFFNNLRKDIPDSIGYEIYSDNHFPIPRELREFIRNSEIYSLKSTLIRIDNYSLKSKKNIRVIYSGNWEFSPDISYRRREGVDVNYKIMKFYLMSQSIFFYITQVQNLLLIKFYLMIRKLQKQCNY